MEIKNTLKISAPISPYTTDDVYPTHFSNYGKGGYRSVNSIMERDSIPSERRENGMVVYVSSENKLYLLRDENWINFDSTVLGDDFNRIIMNNQPPIEPTSETIWLNKENGKIYFRNSDNTEWITAPDPQIDGGDF